MEKRESVILFLACLSLYLFTRLISLEDFPIYFFTDEAAEQVRAKALWNNCFFDENGHFLPVTAAGPWFRFVSIAHYIQLPGWLLFGNAIPVVRGTSALLTAAGMVGLSLILKRHFHCRGWWLTPLVMLAMPAWFLHSRTAFECVYTVVFYIWFIYFYLNYLSGKTASLYLASAFGALTLYSYSAGPPIMLATAGLLFLSDLKFHLQNPRTVLKTFALSCLLLLPLILFFINYPESPVEHIQNYSISLSNDLPFFTRAQMILGSYFHGLSYEFWFRWEDSNLRHRLAWLPHLLPLTAPLLYLGFALTLWNVKQPASRLILILIAASSIGSAFVEPVITRNMTFLVPACILIMTAGDFLLQRLPFVLLRQAFYASLFVLLGFYSLYLTSDCLKNGQYWYSRYWFNSYGLYGLTWGSKELIRDAVPDYLRQHPGETLYLSSRWMNSPEYLMRFFDSPSNLKLEDYEFFIHDEQPFPEGVFIVTDEQYQEIRRSKLVSYEDAGKVIPYPDGTPGFHFVRIRYSSDAERLLKEDKVERQRLLESRITVPTGETWTVRHCALDIGETAMLFDKQRQQVVRGAGGYPFVVEVDFPVSRQLKGVEVGFTQENILTAILKNDQGVEIGRFSGKMERKNPAFPFLRLDFKDFSAKIHSIRLEMREEDQPDFSKTLMHVKEITFY